MNRPLRVQLDFVAPVHEARKTAWLIVVLGLLAVVGVGIAFQRAMSERTALEATLESVPKVRHKSAPVDPKKLADITAVRRDLNVPWTVLLNELEAANHDLNGDVALLSVAPDAAKHSVRIVAEVRNLPDALKYLERLQDSKVLRYPMLESHERRKDDPQHPVRIKLSAEWRT